MEEPAGVDLRIGRTLLNVHELMNDRKYFGARITSDVEYHARLHSLTFVAFHAELLTPYLDGSIVADLGCGQLPYINAFPDSKIKTFYGLDLSRESLIIAARNFKRRFPLILAQHGVKNTPFGDETVDAVISSEVLEHLDDPAAHLREAHRICRPGGHFCLSTPCASMYLYPHNVLPLLMNPKRIGTWLRMMSAHQHWEEALSWHPGLRPAALSQWLEEAGFSVIRHETRLWYYHTPIRLVWRLFSLLERLGMGSSGTIFEKYLKLTNRVLALGIPLLKWCGIRQFALCLKP
jgi:SAM-dependent methyltransferase